MKKIQLCLFLLLVSLKQNYKFYCDILIVKQNVFAIFNYFFYIYLWNWYKKKLKSEQGMCWHVNKGLIGV